jgi:hypothetical protein
MQRAVPQLLVARNEMEKGCGAPIRMSEANGFD